MVKVLIPGSAATEAADIEAVTFTSALPRAGTVTVLGLNDSPSPSDRPVALRL